MAPEKRAALQRAILRSDFPVQFFDAMPSFMASLVLAVDDMARDGREKDKGVEATLIKAFQHAHRPVTALEDSGAVLRQMHGLSDAAQRRMLEETVNDMEATTPKQPVTGDLDWARGNTAALDKEFTREKLGDELYELLMLQRNHNWVQWLHQRMERPGIALFAVGAGHLAGPDALQVLLARQGLYVERVD